MKTIYLIRHAGPFINLDNYDKEPFANQNKNMILSVEGERNASKLCEISELKDIDIIYSSDSARALATAKYIAEQNNLKIKIDKRINERIFGITYLDELPKDFIIHQFQDKKYKLENGESLNDVINRFNEVITEILSSDKENIALFIHGIVLMAYLSSISEVDFNNDKFKVIFNNNIVMDRKLKNPDIFKISYDNNNIINISVL